MAMPTDIKIIDLMLSVPSEDTSGWYESMRPLLLDRESRDVFSMPAQYMFKDIPQAGPRDDYVAYTVAQMDKHNIELGMLQVDDHLATAKQALRRFPSRFIASYEANPDLAMEEVRKVGIGFVAGDESQGH